MSLGARCLVGAPSLCRWADYGVLLLLRARWKHESMPSKQGETKLEAFWPQLRHHPHIKKLESYAEIRAAHMCEAPYTGAMNARTIYELEDGTAVVLDYPIKTSNIGNSDEMWQMDVGPLLLPLPKPDPEQRDDLPVSRLSLGYLVYNRLDYAEGIVRARAEVTGGGATNFFTQRAELHCQTELYAAVEAHPAAKL